VSGRGGSLVAKYFTRDLRKALAIADKLKAAGLRPNVVRSGPNYVVYIATADLLKLAERDEAVRRAIALYLAEKAKNGTSKTERDCRKDPKKEPSFFQSPMPFCSLEAYIAVSQTILNRNVKRGPYAEPTTSKHTELDIHLVLDRNREKPDECGGRDLNPGLLGYEPYAGLRPRAL
jgi:hypothetical protein